MPKMVPVTAFCFFLLERLCWAAAACFSRHFPRLAGAAPAYLLAPALLLSLLRLGQETFGLTLPFDLNAFPLQLVLSPGALAGDTMAAFSAVNFLLLGGALLLPRSRFFRVFQACALTVLLIACLSLSRYLYGGEALVAIAEMSVAFDLLPSDRGPRRSLPAGRGRA